MKSIEILMSEHRVILQKLEEISLMLPNLSDEHLYKIRDYMSFIQIYADEFHHAKEEGILFPWMLQHNPEFQFGPIGCMLKEHDQGREMVRDIITLVDRDQFPQNDWELLKSLLQDFVDMLSHHIDKEDNVLYQIAERINVEKCNGDETMMPGFSKVEHELGEKARSIENSVGF